MSCQIAKTKCHLLSVFLLTLYISRWGEVNKDFRILRSLDKIEIKGSRRGVGCPENGQRSKEKREI